VATPTVAGSPHDEKLSGGQEEANLNDGSALSWSYWSQTQYPTASHVTEADHGNFPSGKRLEAMFLSHYHHRPEKDGL
jgi:hypothetical protein